MKTQRSMLHVRMDTEMKQSATAAPSAMGVTVAQAMRLLLHRIPNEAPLGPERRDHALKGAWAHYRERHRGSDFLLNYRIDATDGPSASVDFAKAGTHAELSE